MKEIYFKKLSIKNFLSIGSDPIELHFNIGCNIITGVNKDKEDSRNGVGKSAIADAFFYSLFGRPLRDIKKENLINWNNKSGGEVSLLFDVIENGIKSEYVLQRSTHPSRVQLFKDTVDISRTMAKTTELVEEILGAGSDLFEQSVVMSLNQTEPFLAKKGLAKKNFIEGIFKLTLFTDMLSVIRQDLNEAKKQYDIENVKANEIKQSLEVYKKQQFAHNQNKIDRVNNLQIRLDDNITTIKTLKDAIKDVDIKTYNILDDKIRTVESKKKNIADTEKKITTQQIQNILTTKELSGKINQIEQKGGICITCNRPFTTKDKSRDTEIIKQYQNEIDSINNSLIEINKSLTEIETKKNKCNNIIDILIDEKHKFELIKMENETITTQIKQKEIWSAQTEIDIKTIQGEQDTYIELINEAQTRVEILNIELNKYKEKLHLLDVAKFVVSEEGVKSFIVKKMLKLLNGRLNYYLKKLDANCVCTFNEYFEENILNERGQKCSYFNFSGGERKRIDLAMLFTFIDIRRLQSNVSINTVIYDELLDSSLDDKGIECVMGILQERVSNFNEAIYIISHKREAVKHATGEIINLEKYNGYTRRIDNGS